ncbi:glycosyltransferase family 4 protein [Niabella sp. CC-SYL272]|uniref:glycosyltransferase family 4 protein n=1 Tax=Niabella agricola TaxID=2891571 RepID=UPI001F1B7E2C|nr:glycosyltransferase family 4 protein [Niabella agricola]MCF3112122.1 glycosyltransferase family 4 protein [Niabella agricola]
MNRKVVIVVVKNLTSGGAEKQSVLLARALADDYSVHYIILNARYQEPRYLSLLQEVPSIVVKAFKGHPGSRFAQFCRYLKQQEAEVVFSYLTGANFLSVIAAKCTGVRNIYTGIRSAYLPPAKALIDRWLCNAWATKAVLNCYSGRNYFSSRGFAEDKMVVIPNCFDAIRSYRNKDRQHAPLRIITVGRFVAEKDYYTALDVILKLSLMHPGIKYQIVGHGALEAAIRGRIKELQLNHIVEVWINPADIASMLDHADIYLSTSVFEGTSNAIMEALNADLPVVATNVGDNDKLVAQGKNGFLVDVKDVDGMVSCLDKLLSNQRLRLEMGQRGKQLLMENYSITRLVKSYRLLIEGGRL